MNNSKNKIFNLILNICLVKKISNKVNWNKKKFG